MRPIHSLILLAFLTAGCATSSNFDHQGETLVAPATVKTDVDFLLTTLLLHPEKIWIVSESTILFGNTDSVTYSIKGPVSEIRVKVIKFHRNQPKMVALVVWIDTPTYSLTLDNERCGASQTGLCAALSPAEWGDFFGHIVDRVGRYEGLV